MVAQFERETKEFHSIVVRRDGEVVLTGLEFAVTRTGARPTEWKPAYVLGGLTGIMVEGLAPGWYDVRVRIAADPEAPVLHVWTFRVR